MLAERAMVDKSDEVRATSLDLLAESPQLASRRQTAAERRDGLSMMTPRSA
jgi:hypothetical protein